VLRALNEWRDAQPEGRRTALGVIANWDERLPSLLDALGISAYLDVVITSREAGVEKPAQAIFTAAREATGVPAGSRAVHVGDTFSRDVAGAAACGWDAVFVTSKARLERCSAAARERMEATPHVRVFGLGELSDALGLPLPGRP